MAKEKDIRQRLYELRRRGRERYLQLMDIDVPTVRKLEKEINAQYEELAVAIQDMLKDAGKEKADMHESSLKRVHSMIHKDIEAVIAGPYVPERWPERWPGPFVKCPCTYPFTAPSVPEAPPVHTVVIDSGTPPTASGSVTYNAAANIAHPIADSGWGQGTGTINSAKVTTSFRFPFMPTTDRTYCIRPIVYMNGHWQVWTWGTCAGTAEDLGSGTARVALRVRVTQLDQTIKEIEHLVFEKNASGGLDIQSGFAYDSQVDGGAAMTVYLQGGYTAVVWVECESYAQIANHGRAWVDMQTSPFFYFKVPVVWWGWRSCRWPVLPAVRVFEG